METNARSKAAKQRARATYDRKHIVGVRMSAVERARLWELAKAGGVTPSVYIRRLIAEAGAS